MARFSVPTWPVIVSNVVAVGILIFCAGAATFVTQHHHELAQSSPSKAAVLPAATSRPVPSATPTPSPTPSPAAAKGAGKIVVPTGAAVASLPGSGKVGFAAGSSLPSFSQAELTQRLAGMRALGATWVRFDIEWSNIEAAGPGKYNWAPYDRVVNTARAQGLNVLGILITSPSWARLPACADDSACAPASPEQFAGFAAAAAAHYRGSGVRTWEIWNEPNTGNHFLPAADAARYSAILGQSYNAIKRVDPGATVISGGTAPTDTGDGNISPTEFAAALYQNGAGGHFDAFGAHPYTYPVTATYPNSQNAWGQLAAIRSTMVARGDSAKKIWLTEYGAPTGGPGPVATTNTYVNGAFQVTEALQNQMVADFFTAARTKPWLGPLFWYSYQDAGTSSSTNENFFGLVRADGTPKPAYNLFQALAPKY